MVRRLVAQLVSSKRLSIDEPAIVPSCMHMYAGVGLFSAHGRARRPKPDNVNTLLRYSFDLSGFAYFPPLDIDTIFTMRLAPE